MHFLLAVEYFSKLPCAVVLKNITNASVIAELMRFFIDLGIPEPLVSDNGKQFCRVSPVSPSLQYSPNNVQSWISAFEWSGGTYGSDCERVLHQIAKWRKTLFRYLTSFTFNSPGKWLAYFSCYITKKKSSWWTIILVTTVAIQKH